MFAVGKSGDRPGNPQGRIGEESPDSTGWRACEGPYGHNAGLRARNGSGTESATEKIPPFDGPCMAALRV